MAISNSGFAFELLISYIRLYRKDNGTKTRRSPMFQPTGLDLGEGVGLGRGGARVLRDELKRVSKRICERTRLTHSV